MESKHHSETELDALADDTLFRKPTTQQAIHVAFAHD